MEKAKIRPLATPKPLNRSSQKLAGEIRSWTAPGMQNFVAIGSGVSVPQIRDFAVLLGWLYIVCSFLGSSIRLQPTPLDGYLRTIGQMTSFRVRKYLLGDPMTIFYIWTLTFPKNRHFGDWFWLDSFFAIENRFNMWMLKYKLPLGPVAWKSLNFKWHKFIILRHALRHLERHFVCVLRMKWGKNQKGAIT